MKSLKCSKLSMVNIILFLVLLLLPIIGIAFNYDTKTTENRTLTQIPCFPSTLNSLIQYPVKFNSYFNDNFGFRNKLVSIANLVRYNILSGPFSIKDEGSVSAKINVNGLQKLLNYDSNDSSLKNIKIKDVPVRANSTQNVDSKVSKQNQDNHQDLPKAKQDVLKNNVSDISYKTSSNSIQDSTVNTSNYQSPQIDRQTFGKDGWVFYTNVKDGDPLACYWGTNLYSEALLVKIRDNLIRKRNWFRSIGVEYYLVLVPNQVTMYPEYLPDNIRRFNGETRLSQLVNYLKSNTDLKVINLKDILSKSKSFGKLYTKTDSHWNELGAYIGYHEIMRIIQKDFSHLKPIVFTEFEIKDKNIGNGDLAKTMNLVNILKENDVSLIPKFKIRYKSQELDSELSNIQQNPKHNGLKILKYMNSNSTLPKALFQGDSFRELLRNYLPTHFSEYYDVGSGHVTEDVYKIIRHVKPAIYIEEHTERYMSPLEYDPLSDIISKPGFPLE